MKIETVTSQISVKFNITINNITLSTGKHCEHPGMIWISNSSEGMHIPEKVISDFLNQWLEDNF